jgi:pimeloyl-ACP methyl ester carboxylesterase
LTFERASAPRAGAARAEYRRGARSRRAAATEDLHVERPIQRTVRPADPPTLAGRRPPHAASRYVDQRGHGESDWAPDGNYDRLRYADDVIELARALAAPPVLVGASLGGISSLLAIHRAQAPIARALVLVDIATRMEIEGLQRIFEFMRAQPQGFANLDEAADAVAAYNPHRRRPRDTEGLRKNLRQGEDGRWRWHWDPRFIEQKQPAEPPRQWQALDDAAAELDLPTLLVRGRMSDILSEEGARTFLEQVPHAKFADISEAGHMVAGDRNDLFSEAVLEFLRDELGGPTGQAS